MAGPETVEAGTETTQEADPEAGKDSQGQVGAPDTQITPLHQPVRSIGSLARELGCVWTDTTVHGEISRTPGRATTGTSLPELK